MRGFFRGKVFRRFLRAVRRFSRDQRGQTTVEYILVLSVAVFGASLINKAIIGGIDKGVLNLGASLEKDLKTGRAPLSVWDN